MVTFDLADRIVNNRDIASVLRRDISTTVLVSKGYEHLDRKKQGEGSWNYYKVPSGNLLAHYDGGVDIKKSYLFSSSPEVPSDASEMMQNADIIYNAIIRKDSVNPSPGAGFALLGAVIGGAVGYVVPSMVLNDSAATYMTSLFWGMAGATAGTVVGFGVGKALHEEAVKNFPRVVESLHNPENYRWVGETAILLSRDLELENTSRIERIMHVPSDATL